MKNYFSFCILFIFCFVIGCNQQSQEEQSAKRDAMAASIAGNQPQETTKPEDLGDYADLVPIEIINAKSKNVFEKYGLEFAGNCYDCDLASIRINKKYFDIFNVCDTKDLYRTDQFTCQFFTNKLVVKTGNREFVFTTIETVPVYELRIAGDSLSLKNKRLSKFYTQKKLLVKFKQHDCGDFEG